MIQTFPSGKWLAKLNGIKIIRRLQEESPCCLFIFLAGPSKGNRSRHTASSYAVRRRIQTIRHGYNVNDRLVRTMKHVEIRKKLPDLRTKDALSDKDTVLSVQTKVLFLIKTIVDQFRKMQVDFHRHFSIHQESAQFPQSVHLLIAQGPIQL